MSEKPRVNPTDGQIDTPSVEEYKNYLGDSGFIIPWSEVDRILASPEEKAKIQAGIKEAFDKAFPYSSREKGDSNEWKTECESYDGYDAQRGAPDSERLGVVGGRYRI